MNTFLRSHRVLFAAIAALVIFSHASAVPAAADENPPVFKSQADYVLVPVVVTDRNGKAVTGLTPADFEVFDEGEKQNSVSVQFVDDAAAAPMKVTGAQSQMVSNYVSGATLRNTTVFALDMINTPIVEQAEAVRGLIKFLATKYTGAPTELVIIQRGGRITLVHGLTRDPQRLIEAAQKINRQTHATRDIDALQPLIALMEENLGDTPRGQAMIAEVKLAATAHESLVVGTSANETISALEVIGHSFSGVPGRKSLVWLTTGFPFSTMYAGNLGNQNEFQRALRALANANVVVYPVDLTSLETWERYRATSGPSANSPVRRLSEAGFGASADGSSIALKPDNEVANRERDRVSRLQTMATVTETTGGKTIPRSNAIDESIAAATQDGAAHYLLSYAAPRRNGKAAWRKLRVNVRAEDTKVRTRAGYMYRAAAAENDKKREVETALLSPLDYVALPISVKWTLSPSGDKTKVDFQVAIPGRAFTNTNGEVRLDFDFAYLATDAKGKPAANRVDNFAGKIVPASIPRLLSSGINYEKDFTLPPGRYSVRFVVRDNVTGRLGSVWVALDNTAKP